MSGIRVVIADDHAVLREGLKAVLAQSGDIDVVGEARNGMEAVDLAERLGPDVVLMDIAMPGLGGLEATYRIRKERPDVRVLVLTQYGHKGYVLRFLRAGASGYVLKTAPARDVISAVRLVNAGGMYLDTPDANELVAQAFGSKEVTEEDAYDSLTSREKEVIKLVAEGMTSRQIADALSVSVKTVIAHRANLMEKLDLHNRAQLIRFCIAHGVIQLAEE